MICVLLFGNIFTNFAHYKYANPFTLKKIFYDRDTTMAVQSIGSQWIHGTQKNIDELYKSITAEDAHIIRTRNIKCEQKNENTLVLTYNLKASGRDIERMRIHDRFSYFFKFSGPNSLKSGETSETFVRVKKKE
jgi:hypothetical protein